MYKPPNMLEVYFSKIEILSMLETVLVEYGFSYDQIENIKEKMDKTITINSDQLFDDG